MKNKYDITEHNVNTYDQLNEYDRIRNNPGMYLGNADFIEFVDDYYDLDNRIIKSRKFKFPDIALNMFREILFNAVDNVFESRIKKVDPIKIEVDIEDGIINIKNYGLIIPIKEKTFKCGKMYIPSLVFGVLGSSSNYDKKVNLDKIKTGTNGLGAKLANIYSKWFKVIIYDSENKMLFVQKWKNGMIETKGPRIYSENENEKIPKQYLDKYSYVNVQYELDFEHLGFQHEKREYSYNKYEAGLLARYCIDISFVTKIPVLFSYGNHDLNFNLRNSEDFANYYFNKLNKYVLLRSSDIKNKDLLKYNIYIKENGSRKQHKKKLFYELYMMNLDPEITEYKHIKHRFITLVNGMRVYEGIQKNTIFDILLPLQEIKGKGIRKNNFFENIFVILNVRLYCTEFDSQKKNNLKSPNFKINIPEELEKNFQFKEWYFLDNVLKAQMKLHNIKELKSIQNKNRKKKIVSDDCYDAYLVNKNPELCMAGFAEGKSGMNFLVVYQANMENGKDVMGILALRGKVLNVRKCTIDRMKDNIIIQKIINFLGLEFSEDINYYDNNKNFIKLRYQKGLRLFADSDDDGFHIVLLVLNFFDYFFPSLIERRYISFFATPIIKLYKNNKFENMFYTKYEYEQFVKNHMDNYEKVYLKGLGSSNSEEIVEYMEDEKNIIFKYTDNAKKMIEDLMGKNSNKRKNWILENERVGIIDIFSIRKIDVFINTNIYDYTLRTILRAIPNLVSGLKDSQSKIIYTMMKKKPKKIIISNFAGKVQEFTEYEHGQGSLEEAIFKLCQNFVGANNIPYFNYHGLCGSREYNGKDHSQSRYPSIMYNKNIESLIKVGNSEKEVYPVLPLVLINGTNGISGGWKVFIPKCNFESIKDQILQILDEIRFELDFKFESFIDCIYQNRFNLIDFINIENLQKNIKDLNKNFIKSIYFDNVENFSDIINVKIFYKGYKGNIEIEYKDIETQSKIVDTFDSDYYQFNKYQIMKMYGIFERRNKNKYIITEIPVKYSISQYRKFLDKMIEKDMLVDFRDKSKLDKIYFEIELTDEFAKEVEQQDTHNYIYKMLKLVWEEKLTNINLLDENNDIKNYPNLNYMFLKFILQRLYIYSKEKIENIKLEISKIDKLIQKIRLIWLMTQNLIIPDKKTTKEYVNSALACDISKEIALNLKSHQRSEENFEDLKLKLKLELENFLEILNTSILEMWKFDINKLKI